MPLDRASLVKSVDEFVRRGNLDGAIEAYQQFLAEQPGDMSAGIALGDLYVRRGDKGLAVAQFVALAEAERAHGFTSKAVALFKKALKADPGSARALADLADIAASQELFADATLYWNRLLQGQRERQDAAGVAQTLIYLADLPAATADTKLAAARAAKAQARAEAARLFAAAGTALDADGRTDDALESWLEAASSTEDQAVRQSAARACVAAGVPERAAAFLTIEVAGDHPALLLAVGEAAVAAEDERTARAALERYRVLQPDDADRASALLARWSDQSSVSPGGYPDDATDAARAQADKPQAPAPVHFELERSEPWREEPAALEELAGEVDLMAAFEAADETAAPGAPPPLSASLATPASRQEDTSVGEVVEESSTGPAVEHRVADVESANVDSTAVEIGAIDRHEVDVATAIDLVPESPEIKVATSVEDDIWPTPREALRGAAPAFAQSPPVQRPIPEPDQTAGVAESDDADEASLVAQLETAARTPALRFQAAAQLGRLHAGRGQWDLAVSWLEQAAETPAPVRDHGLSVQYELADALERTGSFERALSVWADLELDAGTYRDVPERLARLSRRMATQSP